MNSDPGLSTFIAEAHELLAGMEAILLAGDPGTAGAESINELFRAAHTIKGSAGLFGLDVIVSFTHVVESVLDRVRIDTAPIGPGTAAALLECRDHLVTLVDAVAAGQTTADPQLLQSGADRLARLTLATGHVAATTPAALPPGAQAQAAAIPASGPAEGQRASEDWHISVRFDPNVLRHGMDPLSFIRYLSTRGVITGVAIADEALPVEAAFDPEVCYLGYEIAFKSDVERATIEAAFDFVREDCSLRILPPRAPLADFVALIRERAETDTQLGALLVRCGALTPPELARCSDLAPTQVAARTVPNAPAKNVASMEGRLLRVDGDKLDRLIDLIGELIIAGAATGAQARHAGLANLQESALHLARIVEEVREQALKLRIVQIGPTFARFHRVVRDVARDSGKEITLEIAGDETELDKTVVERIADPLTHLVRNAIDHGIEKPELRSSRGKPAAGTVKLKAYYDSGSVIIEVSDDGGGLDRDRILEKARQKGLVAQGDTLSDAEVFDLIFAPGFSTAEQVTNLSGRGVGMDVVRSNVTALRGTIDVASQPGRGTQIRLRLPLTLAIIGGFQIAIGRSSFVIPLDLVHECVALQATDRASRDHISLHGSLLPLIDLRKLFDIEGSPGRRESVVVVRGGNRLVGIVVDELLGELQAVIKPLSTLFQGLQGLAGSTILGDGSVALILDVPGLIDRSRMLGDRMHKTRPSLVAPSQTIH